MKLQIFSIFDTTAGAHLPPFFLPKTELAIRTFGDCVNDEKHAFGAHPDHYTLFLHGWFDPDDGTFTVNLAKESLGNGMDFLTPVDYVKEA